MKKAYILGVAAVMMFSLVTVGMQFRWCQRFFPPKFIEEDDKCRLESNATGAPKGLAAPHRYRILTTKTAYWIEKRFNIDHFQFAWWFRVAQNCAIGGALLLYLTSLGLNGFVGLVVAAGGMSAAFQQSDLSYPLYTSLTIYILTAYLASRSSRWWYLLLPLVAVGALNREDSVMLPLVMLLVGWGNKQVTTNQLVVYCGAAAAIWITVYGSILYIVGPGPWSGSRYGNDVLPGSVLLCYNFVNPTVWYWLLFMFGPALIALPFVAKWPESVRRLAMVFLPLWFFAQFWFGSADETRLFLAGFLLVCVPAVVSMVHTGDQPSRYE